MLRSFSRLGLWRMVALLLLLYGAFDLLAIDTGLWNPARSAASCDDSPNGDDCYCCCAHIVVIPPVALRPAERAVLFVAGAPTLVTSASTQVPELPPRA